MNENSFLNHIKINHVTHLSGKLRYDDLVMLKKSAINCIINLSDDETLDNGENEVVASTALGFKHYSILVDFWNPKIGDFISFCNIYSGIYHEKKVVHCDLNYRVSFFIAYYNILFLGWEQKEADALIAQVWNPQEFSAWHEFGKILRSYIKNEREMLNIEHKIENVCNALRHAFSPPATNRIGKRQQEYLRKQLTWWLMHNQPVGLLLPAFPLKSPNIQHKVMGSCPDQGEYLALRTLNHLCESVAEVYEPGAVLNLFSDGETFTDILDVSIETAKEYSLSLRELNQWPYIKWHSHSSLNNKFNHSDAPDSTVDDILGFYMDQSHEKKENKNNLIKEKDFLTIGDMLRTELFSNNDHLTPEQKKTILCRAKKMFYRGLGLNAMLNYHFPKEVRLSIHHSLSHKKLPITLFPDEENKNTLPWRTTPLLCKNGKWTLLNKQYIEKEYNTMTIENNNKSWGMIEVPLDSYKDYQAKIIHKNRFGVVLTQRHPADNTNCLDLPVELLERLIYHYGFVVVRGMDVTDEENLTAFTEQFGQPYLWQFGAVHKVKPHDEPDGFVHSLEAIPLHWDLSMLPPDNAFVKQDPDFTAKSFVLYCKKAPLPGEGQTTMVDARNIIDTLDIKTRREWEKLMMSYHTPFTYFGGKERTYPLITKHPITGEKVLRYQEGSDSSLQTFTTKVVGRPSDSDDIIRSINDLAYNETNLVEHIWQDGDIVIIDNFNVLHGRRPMSEKSLSRELWRVQVY